MNKKYIIVSLVVLAIFASSVFYYFYRQQTQQIGRTNSGEKFKVNLQQCHHSYGINGTKFGITTEITNMGPIVMPPATIWLLYDNKVCDKKNLDKSYLLGEVLFKNSSDGRWFTCNVELPTVPKDAEKINKTFKLIYTTGKQDSPEEGVTIFSGNTKELCGVAVE